METMITDNGATLNATGMARHYTITAEGKRRQTLTYAVTVQHKQDGSLNDVVVRDTRYDYKPDNFGKVFWTRGAALHHYRKSIAGVLAGLIPEAAAKAA